jgi:hypothetical protein
VTRIILPVNLTETWADHFSSRGWATPQAQVDAGYPIFIQPAPSSGSYQEVFDLGLVLATSNVTLTYSGNTIAGAPSLTPKIELSLDSATWQVSNNVTSVFGTNFRYVRVTITVTSTGADLYELTSLSLRLDSKLRNDAGSTSCVSTDTVGTFVNFNVEFLNVSSITLTPAGVTPTTSVYTLPPVDLGATYSVASNICTVTSTAHDLIVGQKVLLSFGTGSAPSGVYPVASVVGLNSYTVAITTANTSGSVVVRPQSLRIYLFNSAGSRVSGSVSWAIRGY